MKANTTPLTPDQIAETRAHIEAERYRLATLPTTTDADRRTMRALEAEIELLEARIAASLEIDIAEEPEQPEATPAPATGGQRGLRRLISRG